MVKRGRNSRVPKAAPRMRKPAESEDEEDHVVVAPDIDEDCIVYDSEGSAEGPRESGSDSEGESDSEGSSSGEIPLGEANGDLSDVEVGLEFFDPLSEDVTPVAAFFEDYAATATGGNKEAPKLGKEKSIAPRDLAQAVCDQTRVGTMVKLSDDGNAAIGFISCLNVHKHRDLLAPLKQHLLTACESRKQGLDKMAQLFRKCFEDGQKYETNRMGLILTERVVNLPPQIVPKMLEALFCEIEWATEDEPTQEGRDNFRLGWYLYVTEVYCTPNKIDPKQQTSISNEALADKTSKRRKKKRQRPAPPSDISASTPQVAFTRPEDEAWLAHAAHTVTWPIAGEEMGQGGISRRRMAMVISASKIKAVTDNVKEIVGFEDNEHGQEKKREVEKTVRTDAD